jgi:hypothetical protein
MISSHRTKHRPTALRTISIVLAVVCGCSAILLLCNAFRRNGSQNIGWQLLIINMLAEQFLDVVARWFDQQEGRD